MAERLRALLERPLDPGVARAVVALALAVSTGLAVLVLLGAIGRDAPHSSTPAVAGADRPSSSTVPITSRSTSDDRASATEASRRLVAGQDRQERPGTEARRRALRESARHRALQHVPYRRGAVTVELIGVKGGEAVLGVEGPSLAAAHRGWTGLLHRYHDDGRSYLPRFRAGKGARP